MSKLRLSLDDIAVESFTTLPQGARRGTVAAHGFSDTTCNQIICDCPTNGYENTCQNTCEHSCYGGCGGSGDTCNDSCNGTCGDTCFTCGATCEGPSCQYCTEPGQIICG